jgi:uncharacterized protein involved in exopolysaccharide biosynthesis
MLAVLVVGGIGAGVYFSIMPAVYEASARLLLTRQRIPESFVRQTNLEELTEQVDAIVGELLNRESLIAVAEAQNLAERMGGVESASELFAEMRSAIIVEPDLDVRAKRRRRPQTSYIYAIRYQSPDPQMAADVANELANRFTSSHIRRQSQQARLTSDFLRREAERAEGELAAQRAQITEFNQAHRGELPSELATKLARLERLQQQSQSLALQISDAEGRLLTLQTQEPAAGRRATLLAELRNRLIQERTIYTDEHPNVMALQRQIEVLQAEVATQRAREASGQTSLDPAAVVIQREIEGYRSQLASVEEQIRELDVAVAAIPAREETLSALQQQEQLLLERFVRAARKVQEAELAESLQHAQQGYRVSVLDPAGVPRRPVRSPLLIAALAAAGLLGASAVSGLLLEFLDPVIVGSRQLEADTGMAPLGVVPRIR